MEKSVILKIEDFKADMLQLINGVGIDPYFLEPIVKEVYDSIATYKTNRVNEEKKAYDAAVAEEQRKAEEEKAKAEPEVAEGEVEA